MTMRKRSAQMKLREIWCRSCDSSSVICSFLKVLDSADAEPITGPPHSRMSVCCCWCAMQFLVPESHPRIFVVLDL